MKEIECPNCGAHFDAREASCPYCGYINPMGAEAKFLRDLEGTRKELDNVDEEAQDEYKAEIKKGAKSAAKTVVIIGVIIALIVGFFIYMDNRLWGDDYDDYAAELAWEHDTFAEYDELFEAKKYDELMQRIADDGENHDVWNWEHYDEFMDIAEDLWGND